MTKESTPGPLPVVTNGKIIEKEKRNDFLWVKRSTMVTLIMVINGKT